MSEPQPQSTVTQPATTQGEPAAVDLSQLAERVYRLMLADLRLEQARGKRPGERKKR